MTLFGLPLVGGVLPFVGRRKIAINRDGSFVDTGAKLIEDEVGVYYVKPWVVEWLGRGWPLSGSFVYRWDTDEIAPGDKLGFDEVG